MSSPVSKAINVIAPAAGLTSAGNFSIRAAVNDRLMPGDGLERVSAELERKDGTTVRVPLEYQDTFQVPARGPSRLQRFGQAGDAVDRHATTSPLDARDFNLDAPVRVIVETSDGQAFVETTKIYLDSNHDAVSYPWVGQRQF